MKGRWRSLTRPWTAAGRRREAIDKVGMRSDDAERRGAGDGALLSPCTGCLDVLRVEEELVLLIWNDGCNAKSGWR